LFQRFGVRKCGVSKNMTTGLSRQFIEWLPPQTLDLHGFFLLWRLSSDFQFIKFIPLLVYRRLRC